MMLGGILSIASISIYVYLIYRFQKRKRKLKKDGIYKKFILFITYDDQMIEYVLPGMNDRKYMLNLYNKTGIEDMEVSLEVWDGKWYICSNSLVRISREHKVVQEQKSQLD